LRIKPSKKNTYYGLLGTVSGLKNRENGGYREGERMARSFLSKWWLLKVAKMVAPKA
jgi:hypothetical protein